MHAATYEPVTTVLSEAPVALRAPDPTLAVLARSAAGGDDDAFDQLYRRLDGGLRRFLSRRGGVAAEQIEELAQLAWVDVWQALRDGRYDPTRAAITTFLYAVAYKVWLQHRRRSRGGPPREGDATALDSLAAEGEADPGEAMDLAERIQAVRQCLGPDAKASGITADEQAVLIGLCDGESERTLAARLNTAASTVHARKTSAFQKIRQYLDLHALGRTESERPPGAGR